MTPTPAGASAALLRELQDWAEQGWLRRLDAAFAGFVLELCPDTAPELVLAAALLAQMEGRGHSCLPLEDVLRDPDSLLGWPAPASSRLSRVLAQLAPGLQRWIGVLGASPLVAVEGAASASDAGAPPLLLHGSRLYLRRYWGYEHQVAAQVSRRCRAPDAVDEAAARQWLDRLFPAPAQGEPAAAPDWQKVACAVALRGRLTVVSGGPGTGKTHTAARLLALLLALDAEPEHLRVALAAPTGKAATRLRHSIEAAFEDLRRLLGEAVPLRALAARIGAARTLHALLGARPDTRGFAFDAAHPLELDLLIVDEASMIHLEMMTALLDALPPRARLVLLGDPDQLASVEAGAMFGDLCRSAGHGRYDAGTCAYIESVTGQRLPAAAAGAGSGLSQQHVVLRQGRRYGGPIGQLAQGVNSGDATAATALLRAAAGQVLAWPDVQGPADVVQLAVQGRAGAEGGYRAYLERLRWRPESAAEFEAWVRSVLIGFDRFRLLCAVREGDWGVAGLNLAIERSLAAASLIDRGAEWYEGRPVVVTRNDAGADVVNGDIGVVLRPHAAGAPLRAWFLGGDGVRSVGVSRLANVETAFAMTVHKAQGSEFEHTLLVLPQEGGRVLTRELVYTGITRARRAFTLVSGRRQALAEALAQRTQRASGLLELLDEAGAGG